ncbi:unnamed protein product [Adineta steineri]|uniref:Uncharacterized protein n=1 Tax=Adineta steineri TaxID=433720 RepID=A0A819XMT1_9BILA|nr:unnamed protein product [Adineta steineri]CAF4143776.1 unnamed protein product [Adineta steineri]
MASIQSLSYVIYENDNSQEGNILFTPDFDHYTLSKTTTTTTTLIDIQEDIIPYQSQIFLSMNTIRCTILPMFLPLSSFRSKEIISSFDDITLNLTNVPVQ